MWFLPYAIIAGVVFTAGQFFAKKAYEENASFVEEPWEQKNIGEKIESLFNMPLKETVLLVTVLLTVSSLAKSFVSYRGK